jgi:hypothetical protein
MSDYKKLQAAWDKRREEITAWLNERGIEYPRCGFDISPGWMPIVKQALEEMIEAGWSKKLDQAKQKFCQLRIYISQQGYQEDHPDHATYLKVTEAIKKAEALCDVACEACGKPHGMQVPTTGSALCSICRASKIHPDL